VDQNGPFPERAIKVPVCRKSHRLKDEANTGPQCSKAAVDCVGGGGYGARGGKLFGTTQGRAPESKSSEKLG